MSQPILHCGDCLDVLKTVESESVDLFYIDPPFFTRTIHALTTRDGSENYSFKDVWTSLDEYGDFIFSRLSECRRCLKNTGSVFFHCDRNASHIIRLILDSIFRPENFRSEIIWSFRRWSNSQKKLLPSHQTILFYSRSEAYKFNSLKVPYSESTNIDQILQKRVRDERNKTVYERDHDGEPITNGAKVGVSLGDVWDIPYLNPKAKERTGYPTQKPLLLLEQIIKLSTNQDDLVIDPFCGSGTTLIAAHSLNRKAMGIDVSQKALDLVRRRLVDPLRTTSRLLEQGRDKYVRLDMQILECLSGLAYHPVHRNKGMDAILVEEWNGKPVCIRIQRPGETVEDAANALRTAATRKGGAKLIVVLSEPLQDGLFGTLSIPSEVTVVNATSVAIRDVLGDSGRLKQAV